MYGFIIFDGEKKNNCISCIIRWAADMRTLCANNGVPIPKYRLLCFLYTAIPQCPFKHHFFHLNQTH